MNVKVDDLTFDHGHHDADVLQRSTAMMSQDPESLNTDPRISYTLDGCTRRPNGDAGLGESGLFGRRKIAWMCKTT